MRIVAINDCRPLWAGRPPLVRPAKREAVMRKIVVGAVLLLLAGCGVPFIRDASKEVSASPDRYPAALIAETEERVSNALHSPGSERFSDEHVFENREKKQVIVAGVAESEDSNGRPVRWHFENVYVAKPDGTMKRRGKLTDDQFDTIIF